MKILVDEQHTDEVILEEDGSPAITLITATSNSFWAALFGIEKRDRFSETRICALPEDFEIVLDKAMQIEYHNLPDGFFLGPGCYFRVQEGQVSLFKSKTDFQAVLWNSTPNLVLQAKASDQKKMMFYERLLDIFETVLIAISIVAVGGITYQRILDLSTQSPSSNTVIISRG
ncbi:MAG: hypothetical protein HC851_15825 [Acaryochloris sp. RU_4_1]|nr:hypothetical protein [Acaryochloris sp. RU_4_1]